MSFLLSCPNCGQREYEEFRYGGELRAAPQAEEGGAWSEYLYNRGNRAGVQREWWYHQSGCRQWFVAERDVRTNEVGRTYWYERSAAEQEGETRRGGDKERMATDTEPRA